MNFNKNERRKNFLPRRVTERGNYATMTPMKGKGETLCPNDFWTLTTA
jgi:hypothetical protein